MTLRDILKEKISQAVGEYAGSLAVPQFAMNVPENEEYGDYATNAALLLAKSMERTPMEIARELAKTLADECWEVSVAAPGFLNFKLADSVLIDALSEIFSSGELWGKSTIGDGKTVMVEYFQLNIGKPPHVGHLRSAVIGDALKRIFLSRGYHAVSDTHVGDWGTQFGILISAWKSATLEERNSVNQMIKNGRIDSALEFLQQIYISRNLQQEEARKKIESISGKGFEAAESIKQIIEEYGYSPEAGKSEFAKLERGDKENRKIWEWVVTVSMKKLEESAERLGLLPFDEHKGESSYESDMPKIVEEALQKGIADHKEDGAIFVDLTTEKLDEAVLIKSDGASTYLLRDLATIKYRKERWQFWKNIYVVDVRQSHHFRQLFRVAELLGYERVDDSEHVEFGFMKLPEGAISTRKGTAIALDMLLDEAEKRAATVIQEKNPDLKNFGIVAKQVGLGAIKYFDLSHNRKSDVVFEWERALSFEGNTGPYLQYTYARLKSILRKVSDGSLDAAEIISQRLIRLRRKNISLEHIEHRLVALILRYPMTIESALAERSPHVLAAYLYELSGTTNEFYHALPVLQETDKHKQILRIMLVTTTAITLKNGLNLLGIEAPEEM